VIAIQSIPQDTSLPQLPIVLDADLMAHEFDRRMFGSEADIGRDIADRFRVDDCRIERIKYKPGYNCLVYYRLTITNRHCGESANQLLCGRIYSAGGSRSRYAKARRDALAVPGFGPALFHIEPLDMVVWAFPNDRKLHGLAALTDGGRLQTDLLPEIVSSRWGADWRIEDAAPTLVHFVPEHTCCIRVDLRLVHRSTGEIKSWLVFGKAYYNSQGEEAFDNMRRLWASPTRMRGDLNLPRPLGYQPRGRVLWQEGLAGQTLMARSPDDRIDGILIAGTAAALAGLHRTAIDCVGKSEIEDIVNRLGELEGLLTQVQPSCGFTLSTVIARLSERAPDLTRDTCATLHGDLHPKNIFVDDDRISLIDMDSITRGPPLQDIGSFVAALLYRAILRGAPPSSIVPLIRRLVGRYAELVPWPVPALELAWYTAAALIMERGFRCVTRLKAGRLEVLDDLVELADQVSRNDGSGPQIYA
jgi:hypothetical protein